MWQRLVHGVGSRDRAPYPGHHGLVAEGLRQCACYVGKRDGSSGGLDARGWAVRGSADVAAHLDF